MSLADEELLSAYLDGELTADERSRVEKLLAESPENRQLLEELRSIQASLQRMPRAGLGPDFADQVSREAKNKAAADNCDDNDSDRGGPASQRAAPVEPAERAERLSGLSWQRMRRPAIWASLTLAAGLLIMLYEGSQGRKPAGRHVAMAPAQAPERAAGEIGAAPAEPADESQERPAGDLKTLDEQVDSYRRPMPEAAGATSAAPARPPAPAPMGRESRAAGASSAGARGRPPASSEPAQVEADKDVRREMVEQKEEKPGGDVNEMQDALAAGDRTVVVWCDVAADSNYSESFRALLAEQNIKWQFEPEMAETFSLGLQEAQARFGTKAQAREELDKLRAKQPRMKRLADAEQAVRDPESEVVLVEASQPQIDAVLAAIDGASKVFVNIDVDTPPDAPREQQQFQRFARGAAVPEKLGERRDEASELKKNAAASLGTPAAKQAANKPTQNQSAAGTARRLTVRAANESEALTQKADERAPNLPQLAQSRMNRERDAKAKASDDSPTVLSAGLGAASTASAQPQVQVLFVLHRMETEKMKDER
jgi:hypothetical protein